MDRITESLLKDFCEQYGFSDMPEDKQFEHLGAYLVVSRFQSETFDIGELVVGETNDTGFDSLAIIVNGALVSDPESVTELADRNKFLDVAFIFVQSERSPSFSSSKIGQIAFGVEDFFNSSPALPRNDRVSDAALTMSAIYERSALFTKGNPVCRVFYVTTGKWLGDQQLEARRSSAVSDLKGLALFSRAEFTPVGAIEIQKLYREAKNAISREFTFTTRTVIPDIPGVTEAFLGLLPAKEFLSLVEDDQGNIIKSIFYDNVRDWQDYNAVNSGIRDTIQSPDLRSRFALMNNGVTIIAKSLRATGNKVLIEDYQIVNGCQTSHVLNDQRSVVDDTLLIPVRLISTEDDEVIASIIKATNRQTQVREDQLLALSDFQKKLEDFFKTYENGKKLYYERRSRQYNDSSTAKTRVVTMANLIRAYSSIFRRLPHRTTRGYNELLEGIGKSIFGQDDRLEPYYLAAYALYRLESLFRNQSLDAKYKPARYQTLFAFRMLANSDDPPQANSHAMKKYCDSMLELLWDNAKAESLFRAATAAVDAVASGNFHRDNIRTLAFTDKLAAHCKRKAGESSPSG